MNEKEWLSSSDPKRMLGEIAFGTNYHEVSDRKLRLFAVACSRVGYAHSSIKPRQKTDMEALEAAEVWADDGQEQEKDCRKDEETKLT